MDETTEPKTAARQKAKAHLAAATYCHLNQSIIGAIAECQKAVDADPDFREAREKLGYALREKEEIEEEILKIRANVEALAQGLTTNANLQERNKLALFCYMIGWYEEARTEWEWIISHDSGHAQKDARKRLRRYPRIIPPTAVILSGGKSRRMGTDKAMLEIGGMTLLERTARLALAINLPVIIVGRERPDDWPLPEVLFLSDTETGLGPVGGLATALRHAQTSVLALACDLPLLTADALRWLVAEAMLQAPLSGLITVNGGRWEPLFSVYHPECLPLIEARLAAGQHSLQKVAAAGSFVFADAPSWVGAALINANTPEDWAKIKDSPGPQ